MQQFALAFIRKPQLIQTQQLLKPKPLPIKRDESGGVVPWDVGKDEWHAALGAEPNYACQHINEFQSADVDSSWAHANRLGINQTSAALAIKCLQRSAAAEKLALRAAGNNISTSACGRGHMPKLEWKSLSTKSSKLYVEHALRLPLLDPRCTPPYGPPSLQLSVLRHTHRHMTSTRRVSQILLDGPTCTSLSFTTSSNPNLAL